MYEMITLVELNSWLVAFRLCLLQKRWIQAAHQLCMLGVFNEIPECPMPVTQEAWANMVAKEIMIVPGAAVQLKRFYEHDIWLHKTQPLAEDCQEWPEKLQHITGSPEYAYTLRCFICTCL